MPIHSPDTVKTDESDGIDDPCGAFQAFLFSDAGNLTQFGAFEEILPPGSASSVKHWHQVEDELVYVVEGEVTLHEGNKSTVMRKGEAATFKAGEPVGHWLENKSQSPVRYLVVGTRAPKDVVTYPDNDRVLTNTRGGERTWEDGDGNPVQSLYD